MERIPAPGDLYRHVTDKIYQVITVAAHAESGEQMVVYQAMFGDFGIFTMPLARFAGSIDDKSYPKSSQQHLFEKIERAGTPCRQLETEDTDMHRCEPETAKEQDSELYDKRQHARNALQPQMHARNAAQPQIHVRERPHVQRPADSKRILSQDASDASGGGAYYEKRQRQMEEREQRRGMFRKTERHETATEELHANPCLMKFLEADTYEERFHVLNQIQDEITDRLIDDMAVVLDVVIPEGALSDRFRQLRDVILTRQKYETSRFR